jgi:phenylacetate-CoA ligase
MNLAGKLLLAGSLARSQYLDRVGLERRQQARLRQLLIHAAATVPYYRDLFARSGVTAETVRCLADLQRIPISRKHDLQAAGLDARTSTAFKSDRLLTFFSSGSSGTRFPMRYDPRFTGVRQALFLRALRTAGYRLGQRVMLIANGPRKPPPDWLRWHYVPSERPPEDHYEAYLATCPALLYGFLAPLRQLAEIVARNGCEHRPLAVVSTAEVLDDSTRRLLRESFGAPVFDIYGSTETGPLAWQCSPCGEYHAAEDAAVVEFLPVPGQQARRLVITCLELRGMPMIRYDIGDLVLPGPDGRCSCGRSLARIKHIEGRVIDCLRLPNGRSLSPYYVTEPLEDHVEVDRFQVVQEAVDSVTIRLQGGRADTAAVGDQVRQLLRPILGAGVTICVEAVTTLEPPPGRKFRSVECRIATEAQL